MMKYLTINMVFLLIGLTLFGQKLDSDQIYLADPTIFKDNDTYYLYGTKGDPRIEGEGFLVYTSSDLHHWEGPVGVDEGFALKKGAAFGTKGFWAPQVFKHDNTYYMAYTANEHIAIATSNSPLGPFTNEGMPLEAPVRQIDPFIFFDNGKAYLFHVRLQDGNRIYVAEMTSDLQSIKASTLKECVVAEAGWEDTQNVEWPVAEGPTVVKRNGLYYLMYSANDFRNPDYAVGFATSTSPMGPWEKAQDQPFISKMKTNENGSGHGDLIEEENGNFYYVFHTHFSEETVHPRKTALIKLNLSNKSVNVEEDSFKWIRLEK